MKPPLRPTATSFYSCSPALLPPLLLLLLIPAVADQQLVGPGVLTAYDAKHAEPRERIYFGEIEEPPAGFFIGGSSIQEMNGVYKRVAAVSSEIYRGVYYAYRKSDGPSEGELYGWHLLLRCVLCSLDYGSRSFPWR